MKKLRKISNILILAMAIAAVLTSCKKDDPVPLELPTAAFTYAPETVVQYDMVEFTNTSIDAISYLWDFGNGNTFTDANINITFLDAGDYLVKLIATNNDGSDTTEQTITVAAPDNYVTINGSISYVDGDGVDHVDGYVYDGSKMTIDTAYWAGDMIRMLATDDKFDNPLIIKFTPNLGIGSLDQVYTYAAGAAEAGTYDFATAGGYAGMSSEWTVDSWGLTGDPYIATPYVDATITLVFEPESGEKIYDIVIENILLNAGDYAPGFAYFLGSTNPTTETFHYRGSITPEAAPLTKNHVE